MRKRTIIILAVLMTLVFVGLSLVQLNYFHTLMSMRRQLFDNGVRRSLYQMSKALEDEESQLYLEEALRQDGQQKYKSLQLDQEGNLVITIPSVTSQTKSTGLKDPKGVSHELQAQRREIYSRKKIMLSDVAMRLINDASERPIEERVDLYHAKDVLSRELRSNGIDIPFCLSLVNYHGKQFYQSPEDSVEFARQPCYSQILFGGDYNPRMNLVRMCVPTRNEFLWHSISTLVLTSLFLSFLLFCTLVFTVYMMFRQRSLVRSKTEFMNNMTHEFKTPISSISLASQMLNDSSVAKTPDVLTSLSRVIQDETKRLSFQVEKVLQISLLEHEKAMMKFREADVHELIKKVVDSFRIKAKSLGGSITTDLKAEDACATVDELHFTNVLFNLMDNAVKYSKPDDPLKLTVRTWNDLEKGKLYISIEDNGIGIKREDLKKIFEKFHRVSTGNVHNVKGFGLGLAYVMKIVQKHNGQIKAESEFGVGTTFIIHIPVLKK